jgi:hypothetical protein
LRDLHPADEAGMSGWLKWYCVPIGRRSPPPGPWCDDLPCLGHRVRKNHLLVAEVLGWTDGYEDPLSLSETDPAALADLLTLAALTLFELGHEVGR